MSVKDALERLAKADDDNNAKIDALQDLVKNQAAMLLTADGDVALAEEYAGLIAEARAGTAAAEEGRDACERMLAEERAERKREREETAKERSDEHREHAEELARERKETEQARKSHAEVLKKLDALQASSAEILSHAKADPKTVQVPAVAAPQPREFVIEARRDGNGLIQFPVRVKAA